MKCERMIPKIYAHSWDMRTMCRILDIEIELLSYYTKHILDCYSPEHCPANLLPELAEHIGFDYNEFKTEMYNRIVVKHFIRNMILYRGSALGIANAAAIDVRYRQVYPETRQKWNDRRNAWDVTPDPLAGQQVPMEYNEGIPIDKCWIDTDHELGIIYLFIIAKGYFPPLPPNATPEKQAELFRERMRRLLDLAYLQEYVRPVGMYLLPMVAEKVNARTDLTVKAIRIPTDERTQRNGALGTPNASLEHKYDRIHFAKVENPDDDVNIEPWIRTLYHSQLAGNLNHEYFTKPVYHIEGKFLYYDHDELLSIYQEIMDSSAGTLGAKVGDSLYNPNIYRAPQDYSYGPDIADEPESLQAEGKAISTTEPLAYNDYGIFDGITRTKQDIPVPEIEPTPQNDYPTYQYADRADDSTNKNFMINLFDIDDLSTGTAKYTGPDDVSIVGKGVVPRNPVPYDATTNDEPVGTNAIYTVHNSTGEEDEEQIP